mgnify:FL=1
MNTAVSVDDFERAVYHRDIERAGQQLLALLRSMSSSGQGAFVRGAENARIGFDEELRVMTRITGATIAFLADPKTVLNQGAYEVIATLGAMSGSLIELSGFRNTEHLWRLVAEVDAHGQFHFSENALRKAYAFATPAMLPMELVTGLERITKGVAVPALMTLLSHHLVLSEAANRNRNALLGLGRLFDDYMISDHLAMMIGLPWMLCSYADIREKHDIKRHINAALRRWMDFKGVKIQPSRARTAATAESLAKPRLGIVMEYAVAGHAMLRCYSGIIRSLRERFHLVGFSDPSRTDEYTRGLFDEMVGGDFASLDPKRTLKPFVESELDALYYPSVGMTHWAIWACNQRIAPLQFMTLGHPATSHSPEMDFVLASTGIDFDPTCFSEKLVLIDGAGTPFELRDDSLTTPPTVRRNPEVLRIAVPAKLFKLSAEFLRACAEIAARATRPIEFHFFPNEPGGVYHLARQRVEEALPNVRTTTYPTAAYPDYLKNLDACDIALGGFVFGNTNGAVDCLVRALPIVALDGPEIHQGSEQILMRPVGLPEWLIAKSVSEYVEATLRLIDNDQERVALSEALVGKTEAFLKAEAERKDDFADAVWWMYQNRDALLAREEQVLHPPKIP